MLKGVWVIFNVLNKTFLCRGKLKGFIDNDTIINPNSLYYRQLALVKQTFKTRYQS